MYFWNFVSGWIYYYVDNNWLINEYKVFLNFGVLKIFNGILFYCGFDNKVYIFFYDYGI